MIGLISVPPDRPHSQPDGDIKTSKGTKGKDSGREIFLSFRALLKEEKEVKAAVEQNGHDEPLEEEPEGVLAVGLGFSRRIAHQHGKGGMGGDGEEEPGDARFQPELPDIFDILDGGEPHPDHYRIDDTVKGFPEPGSGPGVYPKDEEFAAFFAEGDDEKGIAGKIEDRMTPGMSAGIDHQFL